MLIGGRSLVTGKPLPATVPQLLAALARRQIRVYEELTAQVRRILAAGIRPTHLDTHKHTHLTRRCWRRWRAWEKSIGIRWVRRPSISP